MKKSNIASRSNAASTITEVTKNDNMFQKYPPTTTNRHKNNARRKKSDNENRVLIFLIAALAFTVVVQLVVFDYFFLAKYDSLGDSNSKRVLRNVVDKRGNERDVTPEGETVPIESTLSGGIRPLDEILRKAGVNLTSEDIKSLPQPAEVESIYGKKPIILGLETCQKFRESIDMKVAFIGPSGMFNTGTNLMSELLQKNCHIAERQQTCPHRKCPGMREQVPWGKHSPVSWRFHHKAKQAGDIEHDHILPIVMVKDPYTWMTSMCRHQYAAKWVFTSEHCPNLVPLTTKEKLSVNTEAIPVTINYPGNKTQHESLVGLWNDWYSPWINVDFPRIIVRFEDLMFYTEDIIETVCKCGGGELLTGKVEYIAENAKPKLEIHKGSTAGLAGAMMKYGNATKRKEAFMKGDLEYAKRALNADLMNTFGYNTIDV